MNIDMKSVELEISRDPCKILRVYDCVLDPLAEVLRFRKKMVKLLGIKKARKMGLWDP